MAVTLVVTEHAESFVPETPEHYEAAVAREIDDRRAGGLPGPRAERDQ